MARNAWVDYITDQWFWADHAWQLERERSTCMYKTEMAEWEADHPRPRLRDFMISLGPSWTRRRNTYQEVA